MGGVTEDVNALKQTTEKICPLCQSPFFQVGGLKQRVIIDTPQQVVRRIACWSCKEEFLFVSTPPPPF
jgi:hypothetical protein